MEGAKSFSIQVYQGYKWGMYETTFKTPSGSNLEFSTDEDYEFIDTGFKFPYFEPRNSSKLMENIFRIIEGEYDDVVGLIGQIKERNCVIYLFSDRKRSNVPFPSLIHLTVPRDREKEDLFDTYSPLFHIFPVEIIHKIDTFIQKDFQGIVLPLCQRIFELFSEKIIEEEKLKTVDVQFLEIRGNEIKDIFGDTKKKRRFHKVLVGKKTYASKRFYFKNPPGLLHYSHKFSDFKTLGERMKGVYSKYFTSPFEPQTRGISSSIFIFTIEIPVIVPLHPIVDNKIYPRCIFRKEKRKFTFIDMLTPKKCEKVFREVKGWDFKLEAFVQSIIGNIGLIYSNEYLEKKKSKSRHIILTTITFSSFRNTDIFVRIKVPE